MANILTGNPLILDTAAVISATNVYRIRKIQYLGATAGDDCILEDGAGLERFHLSTPAANAPDAIDFHAAPFTMVGLELASITSGVCHVYCA